MIRRIEICVIFSMVYNFLVWVWSTIGSTFYCLVLLQVPKCFVLDQIFWTRPKIESHIVPSKIFCAFTKTEFTKIKSSFGLAQNVCLGLAQYINYILSWNKKIDSPQNSFGPVEGQGISLQYIRGEFFKVRKSKKTKNRACLDL